MASYRLIDAYVASLRSRIRWRSDVDDVVAEVEDHLYSTVERLVAGGIDLDLAQRTALDRFGDSDIVASAYAAAPTGGLALPTRSTKTAGGFAIVSAALWLTVIGSWWFAGLLDPDLGRSSGAYVPYALGAGALIGATSLMVAAMAGLVRRHGGLSAMGNAGLVIAGVGAVGSLFAWVFTGWGTMTMIGALLFGVALWRREVAPRLPTLLFAGGPIVGALVWSVVRGAQGTIDLGGFWGERWFANEIGLALGGAILAVGLIGLGRWVRSETPTDVDVPDQPLAV
jgi:hypothetical protein